MYLTNQYAASYDAGHGQRYYISGTPTPNASPANYHRTRAALFAT